MHYTIPLVIVALIVFRIAMFIWRQTVGNQKPIDRNGLSIFYPLMLYLVLMGFVGSKLFVNHGVWALPSVSLTTLLMACGLGVICAIPVLLTTNYEHRENLIYLKKSKAFLLVLFGVIVLRFALRGILFSLVPPVSLLYLTFIMATVYMTVWRVGSYVKFRRLVRAS